MKTWELVAIFLATVFDVIAYRIIARDLRELPPRAKAGPEGMMPVPAVRSDIEARVETELLKDPLGHRPHGPPRVAGDLGRRSSAHDPRDRIAPVPVDAAHRLLRD